jgi:membrane protease subunit HflK
MYLETMQEVLPNVQSVYVIDKDQQSPLPLLNITGARDLSVPPTK